MAIAFAGCRLPELVHRTPISSSEEIRGWLHDAVRWLAPAFEDVHVMAVQRRRTSAAIDSLGQGLAANRFDGVVLSVRDRDGRREAMSSELTESGVARLVLAFAGTTRSTRGVSFGGAAAVSAPALRGDPRALDDKAVLARLGAITVANSRIIYAANTIDIDDLAMWSVSTSHDREQRIVRLRRSATRVAWNGTRPVVGEAVQAWRGGLDDGDLTTSEMAAAATDATELMTPGSFDDGERDVVLAPSVVAALLDAVRPAADTAAVLTLVDDPTEETAYGGFAFDDAGEGAAPVTLVERGALRGFAKAARRPGGVGELLRMPSHLRLESGDGDREHMLETGFVLEGALGTVARGDRLVLTVARAREVVKGARTGRVFAEVELVGSAAAIYASAAQASREARTISIREERDGEPLWRSIEAPWLRCRGTLRARRRAT